LPILVLFSWHTLLPLLVTVPLCWATAAGGNPPFQSSALWVGLSVVLFAISAAIVLGLGVLHFSRIRPRPSARHRQTPPGPPSLPAEHREASNDGTGWIHTHPHLGVFLSGTDRNTIKQWAGVDRNMRAVVVDLYADGFARQVGVFDGDRRPVSVATSDVRLPGDLCEDFGRAVRRAYERRKRPAPELLLAVGPPNPAGIT
jgi:hypothetical protein